LTFHADIRAAGGDGGEEQPKIVGRAAVFNEFSEDLGGFRERIVPGAFTKTLKDGSVKKSYWNHNYDEVLGSTKAGTLTLEEKDDGLYFEITPPSWADRHLETIKRGDVDQMSFGFYTVKDRWAKDEGGKITRDLLEVRLIEVSPVSMPAYPQTDAKVRSIEPRRLQELIAQAENDLIDDKGREELRAALADLRGLVETHHSEPDQGHHSNDEPDPGTTRETDDPPKEHEEAGTTIDERIGDLARIIPGGIHA
jgi:HK97 family phage prohead protease